MFDTFQSIFQFLKIFDKKLQSIFILIATN
jgi:hypothetical protein